MLSKLFTRQLIISKSFQSFKLSELSRCLSSTFHFKSDYKSSNAFKYELKPLDKSKKNYKNSNRHSYSGLPLGMLLLSGVFSHAKTDSIKVENGEDDDTNENSLSKRFNFIADTVEHVMPAIVQVEVYEQTRFGSLLTSGGSGFVVSTDGIILTNAHVVRGKYKVNIKLNDGRKFVGTVIKVDMITDMAAIKIDCDDMKALKLANSVKVRPGEFVIALGSPLSLSNTVTAGIVSNRGRGSSELGLNNEIEYIQTDALITHGNSGGPLINLDGKVIGMNTMKVMTGISFAVPSNHMRDFLKDISNYVDKKKSHKLKTFYLGLKMFTLNPDIIEAMKYRGLLSNAYNNDLSGCYVAAVAHHSPSYRGGLQVGDIIISVNNKSVKNVSDVFKMLEESPHLHLKVIRNSREKDFIINAEEM